METQTQIVIISVSPDSLEVLALSANDPPPRILEIKAKINKWDLIKIKNFCTTKETISKVKRQPSEWDMFANDTINKSFISKIYKLLIQLK